MIFNGNPAALLVKCTGTVYVLPKYAVPVNDCGLLYSTELKYNIGYAYKCIIIQVATLFISLLCIAVF